MAEKLIICYRDSDCAAEWTVLDEHGNRMGFPQKGALGVAAPLARHRKVYIIVSTAEITCHRVALPTRSRKQLLQAVPFALEDNVTEDLESLHFAIGKSRDSYTDVCVCRKEWLNELVSKIREAGLEPDVVAPDFELIDPSLPRPVVAADDGHIIFNDVSRQWSLPGPVFERLAPTLSLPAPGDSPAMSLISTQAGLPDLNEFLRASGITDDEVDRKTTIDSMLPVLAAGVHAGCGTNLLQGPFKSRKRNETNARAWKVPAGLAAAWLLILVSNFVAEAVQYSNSDELLDEQIESVFHSALPEVNTIVDPRAQFEQALAKRSANQTGSDFLSLLAVSGAAIDLESGMSLNSVAYDNGQLELSVNARNVASLENIKNYLAERHGLLVEILSADTDEGTVTGQLRVSGTS